MVLIWRTHSFDLSSRLPFQLSISTLFPFENCFSCEVRTSTWPDSARSKYQMFAMHGPPWIVDIETEYILGVSRFRRIGYLCGKRNIYVNSLACWDHFFFFVASECVVYKKSPRVGGLVLKSRLAMINFQRDSIDVQDFIYGSGVLNQPW